MAHAEFIKSAADGEFYFLEIASRVGGAYHCRRSGRRCRGRPLARSGARLEIGENLATKAIRPAKMRTAGIVLSLALARSFPAIHICARLTRKPPQQGKEETSRQV